MKIKIKSLEVEATLKSPPEHVGDFLQNRPPQRNGYVYLDKEFYLEILSFTSGEYCELRFDEDDYYNTDKYYITKDEANKIVQHFGLFKEETKWKEK